MPKNNRDLHKIIHERMTSKDKVYGTTTVGARGQVVIPADARKDLNLKPGDQLLVIGKFGKLLGLMKAEQLSEFVDTIMKNLAGSGMENDIKDHADKFFGEYLNSKKKEQGIKK